MSGVQRWVSVIAILASLTFISCAQVEDACKTKARIVADDKYCDKYWECDNGQSTQYDCPNGLVFAGKHRGVTEGCDYPWRSNYCEYPKVQINPPIGTEHCDWLYGIFGHETSCTRYWTCWNGTATEQLCIGGLLYNENAHSCDWPENVDGCQKHPLCNDDANGNVPLGKSCNRYWQCQGGYPRLQRCPAMLVFDRRSLRCVVPPTEDCELPTTTPAPPEEEQQDNRPVHQHKRPPQGEFQQENQGRTQQEHQGRTHQEHQGRTQQENQGRTQQEHQGRTHQEHQGRTQQENQGRTQQEHQGRTHQEHQGRTQQENQGRTQQEHQGRTQQENQGRTQQENQGRTRQKN